MQSAALGNNEFPVPEIIRVCAGSARFKVFFPQWQTRRINIHKQSTLPWAELGLGSIPDTPAPTPPPPPHSRTKGIPHPWIYLCSYIKRKYRYFPSWYRRTKNTVDNEVWLGHQRVRLQLTRTGPKSCCCLEAPVPRWVIGLGSL